MKLTIDKDKECLHCGKVTPVRVPITFAQKESRILPCLNCGKFFRASASVDVKLEKLGGDE